MFWKKKLKVDLKEDSKFNDNRGAFRISPVKAKPIIITIGASSYHAINISGTGTCFRSKNFPEGRQYSASIRLPSEDIIFTVTVDVVSVYRGLCRCAFVNLHEEAENLLHSYILSLQKEKIRHNVSH